MRFRAQQRSVAPRYTLWARALAPCGRPCLRAQRRCVAPRYALARRCLAFGPWALARRPRAQPGHGIPRETPLGAGPRAGRASSLSSSLSCSFCSSSFGLGACFPRDGGWTRFCAEDAAALERVFAQLQAFANPDDGGSRFAADIKGSPHEIDVKEMRQFRSVTKIKQQGFDERLDQPDAHAFLSASDPTSQTAL